MRRHARIVLPLLSVLVLGLSSLALTAQPEVQPASPQDRKLEVTIPPGSYINFVFSLDMPPQNKPLRVSIEGVKGYSSFLVPAGETVILPVAIGNIPMVLKHSITVRLTYPAGAVYAFGSTGSGQVPFRAE